MKIRENPANVFVLRNSLKDRVRINFINLHQLIFQLICVNLYMRFKKEVIKNVFSVTGVSQVVLNQLLKRMIVVASVGISYILLSNRCSGLVLLRAMKSRLQ